MFTLSLRTLSSSLYGRAADSRTRRHTLRLVIFNTKDIMPDKQDLFMRMVINECIHTLLRAGEKDLSCDSLNMCSWPPEYGASRSRRRSTCLATSSVAEVHPRLTILSPLTVLSAQR